VTSWPAFGAVLGIDTLEFLVKNKAQVAYWPKILQACLKTNNDLKKYAPTLREKLLHSALLVALESSDLALSNGEIAANSLIQSAISDAKIAGRAMGVIAGKLGSLVMSGRISALSLAWALLLPLATGVTLSLPGALSIATEQAKALPIAEKIAAANKLVNILKQSGISLTKDEAHRIIEEVTSNPKELYSSLSQLSEVFRKYPK